MHIDSSVTPIDFKLSLPSSNASRIPLVYGQGLREMGRDKRQPGSPLGFRQETFGSKVSRNRAKPICQTELRIKRAPLL
ncbi:hypothetical protein K0M31_000900, partial [Melipona bicolor]